MSRQRRKQQTRGAKASIAKAQPLKASAPTKAEPAEERRFRQAWRRTAGDASEAEQRTAVQQVRSGTARLLAA